MALWAVVVVVDIGLHQTAAGCLGAPRLAFQDYGAADSVKAYLVLGLQLCTRRLLRSSILCTAVPPGVCRVWAQAALPL